MRSASHFFGSKPQQNREIGQRSFFELALITLHQTGEIRARRTSGGKVTRLNAFETKFGDGLRGRPWKSRRLCDRCEIMQLLRLPGRVDNSVRQRLRA